MSRFGKYRLFHRLAQGGMAEIFLAKQHGPEGFERTVVAKRIIPDLSKDAEFIKMFLDEARVASLLMHPNVVQIFDFGELDGSYFLAMEYLVGEDLHAIIKRSKQVGRPIPPNIAALIVGAACDGLHYAHTLTDEAGRPLNIVHRDVSPANLVITTQGVVKVVDFGIARAEGRLVQTQGGVLKGKLPYVSPEQAQNGPIDARCDVWSLGVVFFELLTGVRVFHRETEAATLKAVLEDPVPSLRALRPDVPEALEAVTLRALTRELGGRLESAQALRAAVDAYLAALPYAPPSALLQRYLSELFGKDWIKERERLPATDPSLLTQDARTVGREAQRRAEPPLPEIDIDLRTAATRSTRPGLADGASRPRATARALRAVAFSVGACALVGLGAVAVRLAPGRALPAGSPGGPAAPAASPTRATAESEAAAPAPGPAAAPASPARAEPAAIKRPRPQAPKPRGTSRSTGTTRAGAPASKPAQSTAAAPAAPARESEGFGVLSVNCMPWCRIYIDGVDSGRNSPVTDLPVPAGRHRLRLVNPPSAAARERDIEVRPGGVTREVVRF